jgi:hypothetical protein
MTQAETGKSSDGSGIDYDIDIGHPTLSGKDIGYGKMTSTETGTQTATCPNFIRNPTAEGPRSNWRWPGMLISMPRTAIT